MPVGRRPKRHNPEAERLTFTAELEDCLKCGEPLKSEGSAVHAAKTVQCMSGEYYVMAYSRRCLTPECEMYGHHYHAMGQLKVSLPYSTYGLDVVAFVGIEQERKHRQFEEIRAELNKRGVKIKGKSVGRLYRQYQALMSGGWPQRKERLVKAEQKYGGLVLMVDGLEPEKDGPGLYVMWEGLSGTPISGVLLEIVDEEHVNNWLAECQKMVGELKVSGTMSDGEQALINGLAKMFPEAKGGLCQLHFLNNLGKPVQEDDQQLKASLKEEVGRLPGVPKLTSAEAAARNKRMLVSQEAAQHKSVAGSGLIDQEAVVPQMSSEPAVLPNAIEKEGAHVVRSGQADDLSAAQPSEGPNILATAGIELTTKLERPATVVLNEDNSPNQAILVKAEMRTDLAQLAWIPLSVLSLETVSAQDEATFISPSQPEPPERSRSDTVKPPANQRDNLLFPLGWTDLEQPCSSPPDAVELRRRYYSYYRRSIRDALTRKSRKPFAYGGLTGYDELSGISQALLNRQQQYGPDPYLDRLQQRLQVALTTTAPQAKAVRQAKEWLIKVERCLNQPSAEAQSPSDPPTAKKVKQELKQIFIDLHQQPDLSHTAQGLLEKWHKMAPNWLPGIVHCYDDPLLPRHNIQLESLFGQMRRHQRRVSGHKETSALRVFGPGLLMSLALNQDEILPWLQSIPVKTYWYQRRKQEEREEPRRWLTRLRRAPVKALAQADDQFYSVVKELASASPDDPDL